jgi:hypothetical protein
LGDFVLVVILRVLDFEDDDEGLGLSQAGRIYFVR